MEPLWSQADATDGNRSETTAPRKSSDRRIGKIIGAQHQEGAEGGDAQAHDRSSARRDAELGKQAARGRVRGGEAGHALEDRNRQQLYEIAKKQNIPGRSKMGKWDLIKAIRKAR